MSDVYAFIYPVHEKWKKIGLGLGLYSSTLETIESDECNIGRTDRCLFSVLFKWIGQEDDAFRKGVGWNTLIGVLQSVGADDKIIMACQTAANKTSHSKLNVFYELCSSYCTHMYKMVIYICNSMP